MPLLQEVETELQKYQSTIDLLNAKAIDADKVFKPFRLVHGVYGQRQGGTNQMVRIKLKYGKVTPAQMRALADTSERFSNGISHITTRQAIQFHFVPLDGTPALLRALEECGLTTREACGNAVRAVCGSPLAGTRSDEAFSIDPYSEAIFRHFLRGRYSANLPRKFKIALAGSDADPLQQVNIQDIGITAVVKDGQQGFRVRAGGGLGSMPVAPVTLYECLPKQELIPVCEALVRLHHRHGDRQNRAKARLKFVLKAKGEAGFRALFEECLAEVHAEGLGGRVLPDALPAANPTPIPAVAGAEGEWRRTNVRSHRESGLAVVSLTIPRGDVPAKEMRILADLAERFSQGDVRSTNDQNLIFRRVAIVQLSALHAELSALGYAGAAHGLVDVVSCPGASTCQLGITLSKNMAKELEAKLKVIGADARSLDGRINISGCPNSCGQHHIGTIGLHGAAAKIGDKLVPHYVLLVGGGDEGEKIHHGTMVARIPARMMPTVVAQLVAWYQAERSGSETLAQYLRRQGRAQGPPRSDRRAQARAAHRSRFPRHRLGQAVQPRRAGRWRMHGLSRRAASLAAGTLALAVGMLAACGGGAASVERARLHELESLNRTLSASVSILQAQVDHLRGDLRRVRILTGQRVVGLDELGRIPAEAHPVRDTSGLLIHESRESLHAFDGDDQTSAIFSPQGGSVEARYGKPIPAATLILVGRTDASDDVITAGDILINGSVRIPITAAFGRIGSRTTCLVVPLAKPLEVESIAIQSRQGVNLPGIAEIRYLASGAEAP